jgi:hypothetical protein
VRVFSVGKLQDSLAPAGASIRVAHERKQVRNIYSSARDFIIAKVEDSLAEKAKMNAHIREKMNGDMNIEESCYDDEHVKKPKTKVTESCEELISISLVSNSSSSKNESIKANKSDIKNSKNSNSCNSKTQTVSVVKSSSSEKDADIAAASKAYMSVVGADSSINSSEDSIECNSDKPPKRPWSAYNLFFHLERSRIVNGEDDRDFTTEDVAKFGLDQRQKTHKPKPKRKHRKTHGKIGFTDLARTIAGKWKRTDGSARAVFDGYVNIEMSRYRKEFEKWNERQEQKKQEEQARMAAAAVVDRFVEMQTESLLPFMTARRVSTTGSVTLSQHHAAQSLMVPYHYSFHEGTDFIQVRQTYCCVLDSLSCVNDSNNKSRVSKKTINQSNGS